jgi:hypothetical protein
VSLALINLRRYGDIFTGIPQRAQLASIRQWDGLIELTRPAHRSHLDLVEDHTSVLAVLLERARRKTMRVWAEQSRFDLRDKLKRRGYRWSDGSDGRPRSWYVDIDESRLDDEIAFLKTEIYLRDVEPRLQTLTAFDRFSVRA